MRIKGQFCDRVRPLYLYYLHVPIYLLFVYPIYISAQYLSSPAPTLSKLFIHLSTFGTQSQVDSFVVGPDESRHHPVTPATLLFVPLAAKQSFTLTKTRRFGSKTYKFGITCICTKHPAPHPPGPVVASCNSGSNKIK